VQSFPKLEALIVFDHTISLRVIIKSIKRYLKYWWELGEPNKLLCVLLSVLVGLELIITVKDLRLYVLADALLYRLVILDTQL
jgi:nitrogen fixation/metabolism regulation signal transduction histidine kinase